jgi:two-component system, chemotaxis family, CheB/CheR fusion protein
MAKNNSSRNIPKKTKAVAQPNRKASPEPDVQKPFLITGIGASAGGFEAFGEILKNLPTDTGMAFVFVQHLDPKHESKLVELLSRTSKLPVVSIQNNMLVEPNKVYVLPQNQRLEIEQGRLKLSARRNTEGQHLPIDGFFQSLAQDQANCAVGVVLSGSNADGTLGLKEIKAEGGITFAQDERTAGFHQMPSSAIAAGCVDFILPPNLIAKELARLAKHPLLRRKVQTSEELMGESEGELAKVFSLLRALHGVDFSHYKHSTLKRRILRRMVLQKTQHLRDYTKYLREHPAEIDALFHDLLINVTAFFRDAQMYEALRKKIFPKILKQNAGEGAIRIWIPGCSSGEEVYSMAISLFEFLGRNAENKSIQIFATDISEHVLAKARAGVYPEAVLREVSPERLRRFFHKVDGGYQISKFVRDCCVFARQNVIEDPPFSKLDMISCRNVLIYLGPVLQKKVMPIFHYALKKTGHLVLGGSETIGLFSDLFTLVDKKNKIYTKRETYARPSIGFTPMTAPHGVVEIPKPKSAREPDGTPPDLQKQVDRLLISQYAPSGVVINSHLEVLQFRGQTSAYIEHSPGEASLSLMKMARPDLLVDLRTAISRAMKTDSNIRREGIELRQNGKIKLLNLQVIPVRGADIDDRFYLVLFEETPGPELKISKEKKSIQSKREEREGARLRDELSSTKESLQAIIEEQEATNEELKSANEEIQSANEELQSTNEELETAKEELQSTNEELTTLNEELQNRNSEMSQVNNDLNNLLGSVNMPILMLGSDLTIRRFTPPAERIFNLIPTDIGRRISDINPNFVIANFDKRVIEVLDTLRTQEHDVQDSDGRWFSLRIRPYRTTENKIDGAVVLLVDIDELKRGLEEITGMIRQPLLTLHGDLQVNKANDAFLKTFRLGRDEVEGKTIYECDKGAWNIPALKVFLEGVLPEKHRVENYEIKHTFPKVGERALLFSGRRLYHHSKGTQLILLAIQDVTGQK